MLQMTVMYTYDVEASWRPAPPFLQGSGVCETWPASCQGSHSQLRGLEGARVAAMVIPARFGGYPGIHGQKSEPFAHVFISRSDDMASPSRSFAMLIKTLTGLVRPQDSDEQMARHSTLRPPGQREGEDHSYLTSPWRATLKAIPKRTYWGSRLKPKAQRTYLTQTL